MNKQIKQQRSVEQPNKRLFLQGLSAIIGATAVSQFATSKSLASAFAYQAQADSAQGAGKLFTQQQMQILAAICETVIPKTDTPSAAELDVHGFIDHQLIACHSVAEQQQAIAVVNQVAQISQTRFSRSFYQLTSDEKTKLLNELEGQSAGFSKQDKANFTLLKGLLVFGYFTTEVGATVVLSYQAVPGGFKGSIPYDSVGKSYGSLAYY